jgi:hypothetical protein
LQQRLQSLRSPQSLWLQQRLQQVLPHLPARPPVLLPQSWLWLQQRLQQGLRLCGCCSELCGSELWRPGPDLCRSGPGLWLRCPVEGRWHRWPGRGSDAAGPGG